MTTEWLSIREAIKQLHDLTGYTPDVSVVYSAGFNNKVRMRKAERPEEKRQKHEFHREDIQVLATRFNRVRGDLIDLEQAQHLFSRNVGENVPREVFVSLVDKQNKPPVAARMWRIDFFLPSQVVEAALELKGQELATVIGNDPLLTVSEAVERFNRRSKKKVNEQSIFHAVRYGRLHAAVVPPDGARTGFKVRTSSVDKLKLQSYQRLPPHKKGPEKIPVVNTTRQLHALERRHGELVTTPGAVEIIEKRAGRKYDPIGLTALMKRHSVFPVAIMGQNNLYPKKEVEAVPIAPLRGNGSAFQQDWRPTRNYLTEEGGTEEEWTGPDEPNDWYP